MDSTEDASRQVQDNSSNLLRRQDDFCERPFCLGKQWHAWGCCSSLPASEATTNSDSFELVDALGRSLEDEDVDPTFLSDLLRMCEAVVPDTKAMRYAIPATDEEVAKARIESVPKKTREDTEYCVRLWKDWAENRNNLTDAVVPPLKELASDSEGLQYWMSRFVMEIRTKKGTAYTPNSLHHLVWDYAIYS